MLCWSKRCVAHCLLRALVGCAGLHSYVYLYASFSVCAHVSGGLLRVLRGSGIFGLRLSLRAAHWPVRSQATALSSSIPFGFSSPISFASPPALPSAFPPALLPATACCCA
ncbi:hypothetical protein T492DRAFT_501070 [Pavlovales sp. CCMP2436]|nr:hypothetical protein T492DRAFT_501070 [Pavlovales sp. CCMP2436]